MMLFSLYGMHTLLMGGEVGALIILRGKKMIVN